MQVFERTQEDDYIQSSVRKWCTEIQVASSYQGWDPAESKMRFFFSKASALNIPVHDTLQRKVKSESEVTQSHPTLHDPMDCSPWNFPGKSTAMGCHFSRGSSWYRDQTWVSCIAGRGFTSDPPGKLYTIEKLPTKVCLVKAMVFPVVMHRCESWTTKKAEHLRIDAFELWCWRRLLRVPWTARRSNQSILKEISF